MFYNNTASLSYSDSEQRTNNTTFVFSKNFVIVLSHWPHVAQLVAELVLAMYFNATIHTSNKLSNLCPRMLLEPFTLATCSATCCRTCSATCGQCESTIRSTVTSKMLVQLWEQCFCMYKIFLMSFDR